ncbi:YbaK/EbsC family protein, partial [Erwinia amylovora]
ANLAGLASALGGTRASLASPAEVENLTGCVFGAIPPFSFHPQLLLVADPSLFSRYQELAFNAGLLEK